MRTALRSNQAFEPKLSSHARSLTERTIGESLDDYREYRIKVRGVLPKKAADHCRHLRSLLPIDWSVALLTAEKARRLYLEYAACSNHYTGKPIRAAQATGRLDGFPRRTFHPLWFVPNLSAAIVSAQFLDGDCVSNFKPDNVLIGEDGRARVVDFGLARALDEPQAVSPVPEDLPQRSGSGERLTEVGTVLGTPGYMAPEQVMGEEADARSDQFSFCVALYEALYQRLPFAGDSFEEFSRNILAGKLRAPPQNQPAALEIPIVLEQALRRGLSRDPAARFPSMKALIAALLSGLRPDSDSQRSRRRKRWALLAACVAILLVVVFRIATLPAVPGKDLRQPMMVGWIGLLLVLGPILLLRKQILRQSIFRRGTYFFIIVMTYTAVGRTIGFLTGTQPHSFVAMEAFGLAALFATEIPYVGKQYLWLVAVAMIDAVLQILQPAHVRIFTNACYALIAVLGITLRPWSTQPTQETGRRTLPGQRSGPDGS